MAMKFSPLAGAGSVNAGVPKSQSSKVGSLRGSQLIEENSRLLKCSLGRKKEKSPVLLKLPY